MTANRFSGPSIFRFAGWLWYGVVVVLAGVGVAGAIVWALLPDDSREANSDAAVSAADVTPVTRGSNATSGVMPDAVLPVQSESSWSKLDDPARDGWTIEVRADQAKHALRELGEFVFGDQAMTSEDASRLCVPDYTGSHLIPEPLRRVYQDKLLRVDRWSRDPEADADALAQPYQGHSGLESAVREVAAGWRDKNEKRFQFKVIRSRQQGDDLVTRQYVVATAQLNGERVEQHATWVTHWKTRPDSDKLRLRSLRVEEFEQTTCSGDKKLFQDCTASVLGESNCFRPQLLHGLNYWLERIQDMRYFAPLGNPGLAVADVNGDGLDDVYLCQEANLPNRLFLQQPSGVARDVSADWQVDFLQASRSALFVDLDNDGDQDMALAIMGGLVVASNEGDHFEVRDVLTTDDDTTTLTAADYDLDGDLDLYVCVDYPNDYFASSSEIADGIAVQGGAANRVYHDANNAGRNSLFRNDISKGAQGTSGQWKFVDVTVETGIDENNRRFSWSACWEDYDNDGDQDLYVANDFGRNNLYANDHGRFTDVGKLANVQDSAAGMSAAWADVNRDGNMDIYVSNMFSSAGSRITEQPAFKHDSTPQMRARWRKFAMGNTLFSNLGEAGFRDISQEAGVTLGRWAWSSNFLDVNNDGWQDIVVANGYITSEDTSDL